MSMQVTRHVLEGFACLGCRQILYPPIKICMLGHSFCSSCDARTVNCPHCSFDKGDARNILLENLYEMFTFPCTNERKGCAFVGKGLEVRLHLRQCCEYTKVKCPLKELDCDWRGERSKLYDHINTEHEECIMEFEPKKSSIVIGSDVVSNACVQIIMKVNDELFLFVWYINSTGIKMAWRLVYLGMKNVEFPYTIELLDSEKTVFTEDSSTRIKHHIRFTNLASFKQFLHFDLLRCRLSVTNESDVSI